MNYITNLLIAIFAFIGHTSGASTGKTDCERRRLEAFQSTHNLTDLLVPFCDEHGEYLPLQCFGDIIEGRPFCACYDRDFGQIKEPSRKIVSCNCIRLHHDWEHNRELERGNEPRCNSTSGEFDPVQCNATHHWCVHEETGNKFGYERSGGCSTDISRVTCGRDAFLHVPGSNHGDSGHGQTTSSHGDSPNGDETTEQSAAPSTQSIGTSPQSESGHQDGPSQSSH